MTREPQLNQALSAVAGAMREDLLREWRRLYKSEAPRYASRDFLVCAISYALQEREFGGLPAPVRRALLAIAHGRPRSGRHDRGSNPTPANRRIAHSRLSPLMCIRRVRGSGFDVQNTGALPLKHQPPLEFGNRAGYVEH